MRAWAILLAGWLALGVPALAASPADALLTQAQGALAGGLYEDAERLAGEGLAGADSEAIIQSRLHVTRGLARQAQGRQEDALLDFTMGLQGDGLQYEERARALFARGLSLDTQGRLAAAVGDYSAALAAAPRAPYALNNRANVYRRQGRFAEAKRDYAAALEANTPNPQYPYYGLGQVAEAEGDGQAAHGFYSRALTADPAFMLARERLQALGAPVEGLAGLPADTGVIVLRPPSPRTEVPVVLRPPPPAEVANPLPGKPAIVPPIPVADMPRQRRPTPISPPGRGAPLRPAITEGPPAASGLVQLGAWRSEAEAQAGWAVAQAGAEGLLDGLSPVIVTAVLPGRGTFYRLRVPARGAAARFCMALAAKGLACLPVRD
jgi:tetratricopeptide (TPR) repeat protein